MRTRAACLASLTLAMACGTSHAAIVWSTGPGDVTFSKIANADPTLAANQDRITPNVFITRGSTGGIFNAKTETAFAATSPADTTWAASGLNNNPTFAYGQGATNHDNLTFTSWTTAFGGGGVLNSNILTHNAVVHLVSEDIYLDINFTAFAGGAGGGGAFTYQRAAAPVPEPASLAVLAGGGALFLARRRKR